MDVMDEVTKEYITKLVKDGKRDDGRSFDDYRPLKIETNIIPNAEGSARVEIGKTKVVVGIKMDVGTPFADKPNEGVMSTNAELIPMGHETFESGPPRAPAIELARVIDRGIRSAELFDAKSLFIEEGKVWMLYFDVWVLDHCGNLFDAGALGAMAALKSVKMPKYEDGKVIYGEYSGKLPVEGSVVLTTFAKIGGKNVVDPSYEEEVALTGRMHIATTEDCVCAMQKAGQDGYSKDEILELIDRAFAKGKDLRRFL